MKSEKLNEAIALIRAGRNNDARQILFEFIRNEPENEVAWIWMAETLTSNPDRMKIYRACLEINPNSKIAKMAITRLSDLMQEELPEVSRETPFAEGGTFNPAERERTGHTGALIGVDGAYILSGVADFDEVIDLRPLDPDIFNNRLESTLNSNGKIESKESNPVEIESTIAIASEPDLSTLVDDETFNTDRFSDRDKDLESATADHSDPDDFSSILDDRIFNGNGNKEPSEGNTTPIKPAVEDSKLNTEIENSLAEKFLRDKATGELKDPDLAFNYEFLEDGDFKLDFEPDLTSFLENENIDLAPSKSLVGSIGLPQDEIEEEINFEDIPLQDALSIEELGFAGTAGAGLVGTPEMPLEEVPSSVEMVKRELSEEFNYIEPIEDVSEKKKRKRKIMFIGAAALVLVTGLSLITVFAFPGILTGGQKITPLATTQAAVILPSATSEKIVLPPVVTITPESLVNDIQETPAMTATETPVIIAMPSTTLEASSTPTLTRTSTTAFLATRTRTPTPTNTQRPDSDTSTPVPTSTITNTPPPTATNTPPPTATNTPPPPTATKTLIPTASNTPLPTDTEVPSPTETPLPTDTPVPDTPVP